MLKEEINRKKEKIAELEIAIKAARNAAEKSSRTAKSATEEMIIPDELHSECRAALNALSKAASLPVGQLPAEVQNYNRHSGEVDRLPDVTFTIQFFHDRDSLSGRSRDAVSCLGLSIKSKLGATFVASRVYINDERNHCIVIIRTKTTISMSDSSALLYGLLKTDLGLHRVRQVRLVPEERLAQYIVDERS